VEALQEQRELLLAVLDTHGAIADRRPRERPAIESLAEHPHAGLIGDEHLETVAVPVAEQEQVARHRVGLELLANDPGEAVEGHPHVGGSGGEEDPATGEGQHDSSTPIRRRSPESSRPAGTSIRWPERRYTVR